MRNSAVIVRLAVARPTGRIRSAAVDAVDDTSSGTGFERECVAA